MLWWCSFPGAPWPEFSKKLHFKSYYKQVMPKYLRLVRSYPFPAPLIICTVQICPLLSRTFQYNTFLGHHGSREVPLTNCSSTVFQISSSQKFRCKPLRDSQGPNWKGEFGLQGNVQHPIARVLSKGSEARGSQFGIQETAKGRGDSS